MEYVLAKGYDRWKVPEIKGPMKVKEPKKKKKVAEKPPAGKPQPGEESRREIGPGPQPKEIKGPPPKALEGPRSRTVADEEAGRQARADLVQQAMRDKKAVVPTSRYSDRRDRNWRRDVGLNTGSIHTGEIVEDVKQIGGRTPLALPTRGTASTGVLPTIGRTAEIPRITAHDQTIDFQAISPARTPFAVRSPIPVGGGRTPEQLAMFHVPGEPVNPTLSTRQQGPIAMSSGSRVSKLAARPTPGKKPGDQGVLFQPARYRSVT